MKIDNSTKPVAGSNVSETRSRASGKTAPSGQTSADDSVRLSGLSAQLQSTGETSAFDTARVAQIKQAISDGKFPINAGVIAEQLISSARELIAQRRG